MGFPGGSDGKESACNEGGLGLIPGVERSPGGGLGLQYSLGWEDPLEEGLVSNILAWRIPWTAEPGGLQFMESQRFGQGHD